MGQNTTTQNTSGVTSSNQVQNQTGTSNFNTTVARDPYAPIIPYLNAGLNSASQNYAFAAPQLTTTPWDPGATGTGDASRIPSGWAQTGLRSQVNAANAFGLSSMANNEDVRNSPAVQPYFEALNRYNNPIDAQTQGLLGQYQQNYGYLNPLSSDVSGALTGTQQAILDQNAERIAARQASLYSGAGRYGSFGSGIGMTRGIAETNNPLIAQFNQSNIQNALNANQLQQAALGGAGSLYNTAQARAQQYGQMLPGLMQMGFVPGQIGYNAGLTGLNYGNQMLGNSIQSISPLLPLFANAGLTSTMGSAANNTLTNTMGSGTSNSTQETARPTPWTTYAGLGLAGLGLL